MDWDKAQMMIRESIQPGTDLNTDRSNYRYVTSTNAKVHSSRYHYQNEYGFVIAIGRASEIMIPWSMLKECFHQLASPRGYDGDSFRSRFPMQAHDHGCHVHVIGQIFVAAGVACFDGKKYRLSKN
jgi:hypothetical protein